MPDVETIDDVRVTTPLRTLIDVIVDGAIAPELQVQTLAQAIRRGLIMRRQLETADVSTDDLEDAQSDAACDSVPETGGTWSGTLLDMMAAARRRPPPPPDEVFAARRAVSVFGSQAVRSTYRR